MRFWDRLRNCQSTWWLLAALLTIGYLVCTACPLGVPGEWEWNRHRSPQDVSEWLDRLLIPCLCAAAFIGMSLAAERLLQRQSPYAVVLALAVLVGSSCLLQFGLQQATPSPQRELKPLWILYDKYASGYFYEATFEIPSAGELLEGYEDRMREGDVLHVGTHPPGLFLLNVLAVQATRQSESLATFLNSTIPTDDLKAFRALEQAARLNRALMPAELAALQSMVLLGTAAPALIGVPVYFLLVLLNTQSLNPREVSPGSQPVRSETAVRQTAWRAACLAATIPAFSIFSPRSDTVYPLTATLFLALAVGSLVTASRPKQVLAAVCGGVMLFLSLLLSLAHLPAVVALTGFVFLRRWTSHRPPLAHQMRSLIAGAMTFLACVLIFGAVTDCNLMVIWKLNLTNHEGFYLQSPRTWWKWMIANPLELVVSLGAPLAIVAMSGIVSAAHGGLRTLRGDRCGLTDEQAFVLASAATWSILLLSGKNMGEAARLWCFLMPWAATAAGLQIHRRPDDLRAGDAGHVPGNVSPRLWHQLLFLQLITALVTVGRVSGYSLQ